MNQLARHLIFAAVMYLGSAAAANADYDTFEPGTDRPGSDFAWVVTDSPEGCQISCRYNQETMGCVAWTWVKPGIQGPEARCWMKKGSQFPLPRPNPCCTSGLVPPGDWGVDKATIEQNTNRPGSDYSDFDIVATPQICQHKCRDDGKCQAWAYAKPGIHGPFAHCWLKSSKPSPVADGNFVSGWK